MIRDFTEKDLESFEPNQFSDTAAQKVLNEGYIRHTLEIDGSPKCVIFYRHIVNGEWAAFLLLAKDFKAVYARELQRFLHNTAAKLKPKKLQTFSVDCEILNKWHKFLGFELKKSKCAIINNKDFNFWEKQWAGKLRYLSA